MNAETIFGMLDESMDRMEKVNRPKPLRPSRPKAIPPIRINTSKDEIPPGVEFSNVVRVPRSVLKLLTATLDKKTDDLNKLLLRSMLPLLLSFDTSTNYARAALKEGLGIEIDFDEGLRDCVTYVGYLNLAMHFVRGSKMPVAVKKRFMNHFADELAKQAVTQLVATNKSQAHQQQMRELQAVVYERGAKKMTTHTNDPEERRKPPDAESPTGLKRKRTR